MGREIAQVMGHQGADWLERQERSPEEQPSKMVRALQLKPTDVVADIGAGTGYIDRLIAKKLPQGKVIAVDVQPEMVELLKQRLDREKIRNIQPQLGTETNPNLQPASIDLAIMVDAYHEFAYPREMMAEIVTALKPGGRVVLAEYRGEDPLVLIKPRHKTTQAQIKKEMGTVGLKFLKNDRALPQQHLLFFTKG
jgi:ubiquinone/menaquinone biosynthesis C-methylase UbiE